MDEERMQGRRAENQIPREIVDLLIQIALKTETGSALMLGYRLGNPAVHPSLGDCSLTVHGSVSMRINAQPLEEVRNVPTS